MSPSDSETELRSLLDLLLDGKISETERTRLEELVTGDASLRRLYVELMHQQAALLQTSSRLGAHSLADALRPLPDAPPTKMIRFPRWRLQTAVAAAAAVTLAFGVWWFAAASSRGVFARLTETNHARWESSELPTATGSALRGGRLRLADGVARLTFASGAEVSLEGPAELELTGPNACFLHAGSLVAHVPPSAHGFAVGTAHAKLIDHGTDFGISADTAGRAEVQVLQGEVELQHDRSGEKLRLLTRDTAAITPDRFAARGQSEKEPDRYAFLRSDPAASRPVLTLTTAGGAGDAAYVVSPNSRIHTSDILLLVKNSTSKNYRRKAYLKFDLNPVRNRRIAEASLTLNFESTGFGYASLTGECTFAVYGVTDHTQDDWSAETINWENAPAFTPDAGSADLSHAVKLGTFTTPRGVVGGTFGIEGEALAKYLNDDPARVATLIVVRETSESSTSGAVHGFAGNRHPALAPPTLRLTLQR